MSGSGHSENLIEVIPSVGFSKVTPFEASKQEDQLSVVPIPSPVFVHIGKREVRELMDAALNISMKRSQIFV